MEMMDNPTDTVRHILRSKDGRKAYLVPPLLLQLSPAAIKALLADKLLRGTLLQMIALTKHIAQDKAFTKATQGLALPAIKGQAITLTNGVRLDIESARGALRTYQEAEKAKRRHIDDEFRQQHLLSSLFSQRQKEIIANRASGEPLTKTEAEYFSRVIRKRLEAILSQEVREACERALWR